MPDGCFPVIVTVRRVERRPPASPAICAARCGDRLAPGDALPARDAVLDVPRALGDVVVGGHRVREHDLRPCSGSARPVLRKAAKVARPATSVVSTTTTAATRRCEVPPHASRRGDRPGRPGRRHRAGPGARGASTAVMLRTPSIARARPGSSSARRRISVVPARPVRARRTASVATSLGPASDVPGTRRRPVPAVGRPPARRRAARHGAPPVRCPSTHGGLIPRARRPAARGRRPPSDRRRPPPPACGSASRRAGR